MNQQPHVRSRITVQTNNAVAKKATGTLIEIKRSLLKEGYTEKDFADHKLEHEYLIVLNSHLKKIKSQFVCRFKEEVPVSTYESLKIKLDDSDTILDIIQKLNLAAPPDEPACSGIYVMVNGVAHQL